MRGPLPNACSDECRRLRAIEYRRRYYDGLSPERRARHKKMSRVARYGLTPASWDALLASQGAACAACGTKDPGRYWHTDHDHATGVVRGILCHSCNTALGLLKDSPERLEALLSYLDGKPLSVSAAA